MIEKKEDPRLYGIKNSNRDFSKKETWGKNQFNSSFPAALACYMYSLEIKPVYIKLNNEGNVFLDEICVSELYGKNPLSDDIYYSFETAYLPFQHLVSGTIPRIDLVTLDRSDNNKCLSPVEIKLTALPDNTTCDLDESKYGTEIVIRPDTIVYLACSITKSFQDKKEELEKIIQDDDINKIADWTNGQEVINFVKKMIEKLNKVLLLCYDKQQPLIMQPIWKTKGKSSELADNCLDIFVWSDYAFAKFFIEVANKEEIVNITRIVRTVIWLYKMLFDFVKNGRKDHKKIIDELSYNTKNDKAFSVSGLVSYPYMKSDVLVKPRITKRDIKKIVLGGGQNLLSPERRFDAIICNSPELFQ